MESRNQIWGPYLTLLLQDADVAELHYIVKNNRVSPYLELQTDSLYEGVMDLSVYSHVDVNPYVRFFSVFDPLLTADDLGYEEFNQALSDVLLHYLADLDIRLGMCKRDFYIRFLVRDLEQGAYGGQAELTAFTGAEKQVLAGWLYRFYRTGDGPGCLSGAARALLPTCEILLRDGVEFVFYMREPWNELDAQRLSFLMRLFLPLAFSYVVHWTRTYGVVGYGGTMHVGRFLLA